MPSLGACTLPRTEPGWVAFTLASLLLFPSCAEPDVSKPGGRPETRVISAELTGSTGNNYYVALSGTDGYAGILVDCCYYHLTGNQVLGNVVDNVGPFGGTNEIHGIYVAGPKSVIENNIVTRASAACIHLWHGATNVIISNNVVANCGRYGIAVSADSTITTADSTTVANNIVVNVASSGGYGYGLYEYPATGYNNVFNHNIVYNNPGANVSLRTGTESGTMTLTAAQFASLFVNYTGDMNGDYHLQSGAVAIDAGTTACAAGVTNCVPLTDFDGVARPQGLAYDVGAYEWH